MLLLYEYLLPELPCTCIMVFVSGIRLQSYRLRQFNQHVFAHQNMRSTDSKPFFITDFFNLSFISLEIKNCKYKYIFNILVSSIKILKIPGLEKFISKKHWQSKRPPIFHTTIVTFENISKTEDVLKKSFFFIIRTSIATATPIHHITRSLQPAVIDNSKKCKPRGAQAPRPTPWAPRRLVSLQKMKFMFFLALLRF